MVGRINYILEIYFENTILTNYAHRNFFFHFFLPTFFEMEMKWQLGTTDSSFALSIPPWLCSSSLILSFPVSLPYSWLSFFPDIIDALHFHSTFWSIFYDVSMSLLWIRFEGRWRNIYVLQTVEWGMRVWMSLKLIAKIFRQII